MDIKKILTPLLLRTIEFEKLGLKGQLVNLLFATDGNGFHIEFHLAFDDDKRRIVKIPYPFAIESHLSENLLFLDYRLNTIFPHHRWKGIVKEVKERASGSMKFFDTIHEIRIS